MIEKNFGNIDFFKGKIEKGKMFEKYILIYEKSQNENEVYALECNQWKKANLINIYVGKA